MIDGVRLGLRPGLGSLIKNEPEGRRTGLRKREGAGRRYLLPVCLVLRREPAGRTSLRLTDKSDGRELNLWPTPALIAGQTGMDLNMDINPGGAGRFNQ